MDVLGIERRRRWSRDEKARLVEETLAAGAVVSEVARRHGVAQSLLFTWRRLARTATQPSERKGLDPASGRDRRDGAIAGGDWTGAPVEEREMMAEARRHRDRARLREPRARRQRRRRQRASSGSGRFGRAMIPIPSGVRVWIAGATLTCAAACRGLRFRSRSS